MMYFARLLLPLRAAVVCLLTATAGSHMKRTERSET